MRLRMALFVVWLAGAGNASLSGCRGCSPAPAPAPQADEAPAPVETPVAEAGPVAAAPEDVPPTPAPATPDAATPPDQVVRSPQLGELLRRLQAGQPVARAMTGLEIHEAVAVVEDYVRCLAGTRPEACMQLSENGDHCRRDAEQIAARARGLRGWVATPGFSAAARSFGYGPEDVQHYAEAVETGNPAVCPAILPDQNDCAAAASGDLSRCDSLAENRRNECRQHAGYLSTLRRGVAPLVAGGGARAAIGRSPAHPEGCEHVFDPPPSAAPAAAPAPAPAPAAAPAPAPSAPAP